MELQGPPVPPLTSDEILEVRAAINRREHRRWLWAQLKMLGNLIGSLLTALGVIWGIVNAFL